MEYVGFFLTEYGSWLLVSILAVTLFIILRGEIVRTRQMRPADKTLRVFWSVDVTCPSQQCHLLKVSKDLQRNLAEAGQDANDTIYIGNYTHLKKTTFADFLRQPPCFL